MNNIKLNNQPKIILEVDNFKRLLLESDIIVDKSLLIKSTLETSEGVFLITRPRRWGKSINLDMLKTFFEIEVDSQGKRLSPTEGVNYKFFVGGEMELDIEETKKLKPLKIADHTEIMKHQGQYPTILLDFKDAKGDNYQEIEDIIKDRIITLFAKYPYLKQYLVKDNDFLVESQKKKLNRYLSGEINKADLQDSLRFLSEILCKHFEQRVYVLIDEYDAIINHACSKLEPKEFKNLMDLFGTMLGAVLKSNSYLKKGILTGILRVAKISLFSDLNNVTEYNLLGDRFTEYYGFTQAEVDDLFKKAHIDSSQSQTIKEWYNGYTFGGQVVYNPWSMTNCLSKGGTLDNYWINSGKNDLIDPLLLSDNAEVQADLQTLLKSQSITKKIYTQVTLDQVREESQGNNDIFYSLLVFTGYLNPKPVNDNLEDSLYNLTIPNKEVKKIYEDRLVQWITRKLGVQKVEYSNFIKLLLNQKIREFESKLKKYLLNASSFFQTGKRRAEVFYSGMMLGLVITIEQDYLVESEPESGKGRPDLVLTPKPEPKKLNNTAFIIEYKVCDEEKELKDTAKVGLQQIDDQCYDAKLKQHSWIKQITKLSLAFCGKEVVCEYKLESIKRN